MVTALDHVENLRKQLLDKRRAKEQEFKREIDELNELIRALGEAPRFIKGGVAPPRAEHQEERQQKASTRYNLTFAKDVEEYVAAQPFDEAIKIGVMLDTLRKEKGLQGKPRSLYAYASQILSRLVRDGKLNLKHEDKVGYFRSNCRVLPLLTFLLRAVYQHAVLILALCFPRAR